MLAVWFYRMHRYDRLIENIAADHLVPAALVKAIIWRESRFNPVCVGSRGEIGLMQVTDVAAEEWANATAQDSFQREQLYHPDINLQAGTWYLARALDFWSEHPESIHCALAEYNAGRSNAIRWNNTSKQTTNSFIACITYPSTQEYINDIMMRYRKHRP